MTTQQMRGSKAAPTKIVTTNTGRIMRIPVDAEGTVPPPPPVVVTTSPAMADPARRADVLFRVRRDEGHELSAWWMVGAFVVTSGLVILLLSGIPAIA